MAWCDGPMIEEFRQKHEELKERALELRRFL